MVSRVLPLVALLFDCGLPGTATAQQDVERALKADYEGKLFTLRNFHAAKRLLAIGDFPAFANSPELCL
jgi:hypothetical protein